MRVSSINCYYLSKSSVTKSCKPKSQCIYVTPKSQDVMDVSFKGKAGSILGILAGGAAAVGLAIVAAPVLICSGPLLGAAGMYVGDKAEEKIANSINKHDDTNKK